MTRTRLRAASLGLLLLLVSLSSGVARAENWPQWRGPNGDGVSRETDTPIAWSESKSIVWKCELPPWGCSTPAVWGDAVFLTSHVENRDLLLLKIDKQTGKIVWQRTVDTVATDRMPAGKAMAPHRGVQKFHLDHNLASPSPVTDGKLVIVHFGNGVLAAYDFAGNVLWLRNLQEDHGPYTIWWGHANSPVLHDNLVISVCMQDSCTNLDGPPSPSYVVAHDKQTGGQVWKAMRMTSATAESCDSYATPILRRSGDRVELVVMGGLVLDAYDPANGKRLWYLPGLIGNRTITGPVVAEDMIFVTQGMRQPLLAVKPGGPGERTHRDVAWKVEQGTPDSPTPVGWGEWLYLVTNDGIARCINIRNGRQGWKERLKGDYRASPLAVEGRIYFLNTKGLCTVVSASSRFDRLTENQLDDQTLASPAVSDGKLFIRGRKTLYCIRK